MKGQGFVAAPITQLIQPHPSSMLILSTQHKLIDWVHSAMKIPKLDE
jgi:hypothetical protein